MSTQKPGSPDGAQDQSIPNGYVELVSLRRELFDLAMTLSEMRSRIHCAEQTVASLASYAEDLMRATARSTSTPRESMLDDSSSTTPPSPPTSSPYVRGRWTQSHSGEWEYEHLPSMDRSSLQSKWGSSSGSTPTTSTAPSTMTTPGSRPGAPSDRPSSIDSPTASPGRVQLGRTLTNFLRPGSSEK